MYIYTYVFIYTYTRNRSHLGTDAIEDFITPWHLVPLCLRDAGGHLWLRLYLRPMILAVEDIKVYHGICTTSIP